MSHFQAVDVDREFVVVIDIDHIIQFDVVIGGEYYAVEAPQSFFTRFGDNEIYAMALNPLCDDVQFMSDEIWSVDYE